MAQTNSPSPDATVAEIPLTLCGCKIFANRAALLASDCLQSLDYVSADPFLIEHLNQIVRLCDAIAGRRQMAV